MACIDLILLICVCFVIVYLLFIVTYENKFKKNMRKEKMATKIGYLIHNPVRCWSNNLNRKFYLFAIFNVDFFFLWWTHHQLRFKSNESLLHAADLFLHWFKSIRIE